MKRRFFTLIMAFLATLSGVVWGQTTYKVSFTDEVPEGLITETVGEVEGDTWTPYDAILLSINGEEQWKLKRSDFEEGISVKAGSTVSLKLKLRPSQTSSTPTIYEGYNLLGFNIQESDNITSAVNLSFTMPEGNVTIRFLNKTGWSSK